MIACKVNSITNVHVFEINTQENVKSISYLHKIDTPKVKISDDMNSTFLSIGHENYIKKGDKQSNFPRDKKKFVREAINVKDGYYLLLTKNYDRDIHIKHTKNFEYEAYLVRMIEPGIFKVFDYMVN